MKRIIFSLMLLGASFSSVAQIQSLSNAVKSDNVCLVQGLYKLPEATRSQRETSEQLVQSCIGFEKGVGSWYLSTRDAEGHPTQANAPDAQKMIARSRAMGRMFLEMALQRCEGISEGQCLGDLKLTPEP